MNIFKIAVSILLTMTIVGCEEKQLAAKTEVKSNDSNILSEQANSKSKRSDTPSISHLQLKNNRLIINGSGLNSIDSLQVKTSEGTIDLEIKSISKKKINTTATAPLKLIANSLMELIISSAHGADAIPIYVELPDVTGVQGPAGPQGLKGEQGDKGERGDKGEQGDRGDRGDRGYAGAGSSSIVLKDSNGNTVASVLGVPGDGATRVWVLLPNDYLVSINTLTGEISHTGVIYFSESSCKGKVYTQYKNWGNNNLYTRNSIYKLKGINRFFKMVDTTLIQSEVSIKSNWDPLYGCQQANSSDYTISKSFELTEIPPLTDFSDIAPLKLEQE